MPLSSPQAYAPSRPALPARPYTPTGEQSAIIEATHTGQRVVAEALAGTGKTSTLVQVAQTQPRRRALYLAFNKSVQIEADGRFPEWVDCRTAHSVAFQAVGKQYADRLPGKPGQSRMSAQQMARIMKVKPAMLDTGTINPVHLTRMAQATVNTFMKTADRSISRYHIPPRVLSTHSPHEVADIVLPVANRIWEDLQRVDGKFYFPHDVYLKLWQLTNPQLPVEYVMFDEAQDADPVIAHIVASQQMQQVYCGDRNQAIYGWRGAIDALSQIQGATRLPLTKSFRFGPAIAEAANEWLDLLGSPLRVIGHDPIQSTIGPVEIPRAILCRGNGTALGWVIKFQQIGIKVALAPGDKDAGKDISRFAWAAKDLMQGNGTDHPDLVGFQTWQELVKFVEEEENTDDLKRLVGIINRVGVSGVIDAVKGLSLEKDAQITVSTAHKAKGLEWESVRVADDFVPPQEDEATGEMPEPDYDAMKLAYVTVTRAKMRLDPGALAEPHLWG